MLLLVSMIQLVFLFENCRYHAEGQEGESLLDIIRRMGLPVPAPCGGKGVCGKCLVEVEGVGTVQACQFFPDGDLLVHLPGKPALQILTESFWPDNTPELDLLREKEQLNLGLAIDLGTTTIAVFLEDLQTHQNLGIHSMPNPQAPWGADVISRISFCRERDDGTKLLQQTVIEVLDRAAGVLCHDAGLESSRIGRVVVAGNPTMLHLLAGVNPEPLATYPFTPVFLEEQQIDGLWRGMHNLRNAHTTLLPSISGYVGADITAGLTAVALEKGEGYRLFIDIGTNGEIVLWNNHEILTCATAAGPAFEGARISCGMAGVSGAVSAIKPDGTIETINNAPAIGLCGSGLVDAVAMMLDQGVLAGDGYLPEPVEIAGNGSKDGVDGRRLALIPQDIREVQLAKGAIAAGIEVLMQEAGITPQQVEKVFLAGGFGYALHDWSASRIGLIPPELVDRIVRVGNSAGLGARLWLHSSAFRQLVRNTTSRMKYVELSGHPAFNDLFIMNMAFS